MSKIRWKLTVTYLTVIFASMTVVGIYLSYSLEKQTAADLREKLESHLGLATELIGAYMTSHPNSTSVDPVCAHLAQQIKARVVVCNLVGKVIGDSSRSSLPTEPSQRQEKRLGDSACRICHAEARMSNRAVKTGNIIVNGQKAATVEVSASTFGAKHTSGKTRRIILSCLIITTLIAAALSQRLAAGIADPISKMNRMAKEIAAGRLDQQVDIQSSDEVGQFAESFNTMAQRLREMMDTMSRDKDKMAAILATMADGIVVTDGAGLVLLFNQAAERMFLLRSKDVINQSAEKSGLPADIAGMVRETLDEGGVVRRLVTVSESPEVILSAHSALIQDAKRHKVGVVVALRDVTERLHQERSQRDFVANVSHELRTPITAVRVTAEALRSGAKDDPKLLDKFLSSLVNESERLSNLIDDLLEIAKLDAGRRTIRQAQAQALDVVEKSVAYVTPKAQQYNLKIEIDVPTELAIFVDQEQIERALTNLLDNAVKYTPSGGTITVTAERDGDWASISVEDTGIGIPQDEIRRIFERFYRVDKARSRELGGTGLGLSIVRDIVSAHGGAVIVQSVVDKGSTFTFTVPLWRSDQVEA